MGVLLWPIYWVIRKTFSFEWSLDQEKGLQQFKVSVQIALSLGLCILAVLMCIEVLLQIEVPFGIFNSPYRWIAMQAFRILKVGHAIIQRWLPSFWEVALGLLVGLGNPNAWQWAPKLPRDLSCPTCVECYLTHGVINCCIHNKTHHQMEVYICD